MLLTPTIQNLKNFDIANCGPIEGKYFPNYYYTLGFLVFIWILILTFQRYKKAEKEFKKQILLLSLGISLFLLNFFSVGFLASWLYAQGIISDFRIEQYAFFGMPIFLGFLAYLIVKYKAFNIKLLGTQALVFTLIILIFSELSFFLLK